MGLNATYYDIVAKARAGGTEPVARYKKAIVGQVCVSIIDPFTGSPLERILKGKEGDQGISEDDITVTLWTEMAHDYFRRANQVLLQAGYITPFNKEVTTAPPSVNEISDEELIEILNKKFFAMKAFLDKVTSPIPVLSLLRLAEDMNRPVGTINAIKEKLSQLQAEPE